MTNEMTPAQIEAARIAYVATHPDLGVAVAAWAAHKRKVAALLAAGGARGVAAK